MNKISTSLLCLLLAGTSLPASAAPSRPTQLAQSDQPAREAPHASGVLSGEPVPLGQDGIERNEPVGDGESRVEDTRGVEDKILDSVFGPGGFASGPGGVDKVRDALLEGDYSAEDLLRYAVGVRRVDAARLALELGADPNCQRTEGADAVPLLCDVAESGSVALMQLLVEKGADIDATGPYGSVTCYAAAAGDLAMVRYLSSVGVDLDGTGSADASPAFAAALSGKVELMRFLEERGCDLAARDSSGQTPMFAAVAGGNIDMVRFLEDRGMRVNDSDNALHTPLFTAATLGDIRMADHLVREKGLNVNDIDADGRTPLACAVEAGRADMVRHLLSLGADPTLPGSAGTSFSDLLFSGDAADIREAFSLLWDNVAAYVSGLFGWDDKPAADSDEAREAAPEGPAPLVCLAAESGSLEILDILLARGLSLDAQGPEGGVLSYAAMGGSTAMLDALVAKGCRAEKGSYEETMLPLGAAQSGDVEVMRRVEAMGVPLDVRRPDGLTPVFSAAVGGHLEMLGYLAEKGLKLDAKDDQGMTPLFYAVAQGHVEMAAELIRRGLKVDERAQGGSTPLAHAALDGTPAIVAMLVERGADVNARDDQGSSVLAIAVTAGNETVVKYLREHGAVTTRDDLDLHVTMTAGRKDEMYLELESYLGVQGTGPDAVGETLDLQDVGPDEAETQSLSGQTAQ